MDGYTIYRNEDNNGYPFYRHHYLVDGRNVEGDPAKGLWTLDELGHCKTKKDVLTTVMAYKDKYDKIEVWEEYTEEDITPGCLLPSFGDTVRQILHTYVKGKLVSKERML